MYKTVKIKSSCLSVCLSHCLSDRTSSSVGILYGARDHVNQDLLIFDASLCQRSGKIHEDQAYPFQKDMAKIAHESWRLSHSHKRELYAVGWYHSHPEFSCEPTVYDYTSHLKISDYLHPAFVSLTFSVFLPDRLKRVHKYPLHECGILKEFETEREPIEVHRSPKLEASDLFDYQMKMKSDDTSNFIEFLATQLAPDRKLEVLPVEILYEPFHPSCLQTLGQLPSVLLREENAFHVKRMEDVYNSGDINNQITALCETNLRAAHLKNMTSIVLSISAPYITFLEDKIMHSLNKKHALESKKEKLQKEIENLKHIRH